MKNKIDRWDVELWAARSRKDEVCGILGYKNKPLPKPCKHCGYHFCPHHRIIHRITAISLEFNRDTSGDVGDAIKEKLD